MRPLFWIVGVPLLLVGAFFAVANRESVSIDQGRKQRHRHLAGGRPQVGALYLGFLLGALVAWWAGRHGRVRARAVRRRVVALEQENQQLQQRADRLAADAGRTLPSASAAALPRP